MRSTLSVIALVACLITVVFVASVESTSAEVSPQKIDSTLSTSLMGQKVFIYFSAAVHAPTPTGTNDQITSAVYANYAQGKLLTLSDGWIELEMAGDHRHVLIPIRSVGYVIADNSPATQP